MSARCTLSKMAKSTRMDFEFNKKSIQFFKAVG